VAKHVSDDCRVMETQQRELLGNELPDTDILEADCVHHPAGGFADARGGRAVHWLNGKPFDNESTEAAQIHDIGELNAIAEGAAGG
jgi:hypothetical protein